MDQDLQYFVLTLMLTSRQDIIFEILAFLRNSGSLRTLLWVLVKEMVDKLAKKALVQK